MGEEKQEITFQLTRIENLDDSERGQVEGLAPEIKKGLIIKEYKSGSFVKLRKFVAKDNSFISQLREGLEVDDRKKITAHINNILAKN